MFTIRDVAGIHGEKPGLLQSWADKGWAQITPAPGPGQTRDLSIVDVYWLSIAIAITNGSGVPADKSNTIARDAIYGGNTFKNARKRTWRERGETEDEYYAVDPSRKAPVVRLALADLHPAFRWRDVQDPYLLFADLGSQIQGPAATYVTPPMVHLVPAGDHDALRPILVASTISIKFNLTELLAYVDSALSINPSA